VTGEVRRLVAIARTILVIIWHLLADRAARYDDPGGNYYITTINTDRKLRGHIRQIQSLGYDVTITPSRRISTRQKPADVRCRATAGVFSGQLHFFAGLRVAQSISSSSWTTLHAPSMYVSEPDTGWGGTAAGRPRQGRVLEALGHCCVAVRSASSCTRWRLGGGFIQDVQHEGRPAASAVADGSGGAAWSPLRLSAGPFILAFPDIGPATVPEWSCIWRRRA
jgi:hypothetical protein